MRSRRTGTDIRASLSGRSKPNPTAKDVAVASPPSPVPLNFVINTPARRRSLVGPCSQRTFVISIRPFVAPFISDELDPGNARGEEKPFSRRSVARGTDDESGSRCVCRNNKVSCSSLRSGQERGPSRYRLIELRTLYINCMTARRRCVPSASARSTATKISVHLSADGEQTFSPRAWSDVCIRIQARKHARETLFRKSIGRSGGRRRSRFAPIDLTRSLFDGIYV